LLAAHGRNEAGADPDAVA